MSYIYNFDIKNNNIKKEVTELNSENINKIVQQSTIYLKSCQTLLHSQTTCGTKSINKIQN